ncbi:MAG: patatin family protein [Clostridia bacterium]|nr:patatin family protein [Clostridia bacterium]
MLGVIDVGGGLRGIYGAGVFDRCIDEKIHFDNCIGVSAGGANVITYMAGQKGRNYRFYYDYAFRKEYMSLSNFAKTGSYIGLDYIYGTLSNEDGEDPVDFDNVTAYDGTITVVATDADTAKPHYFSKDDFSRNNYRPLCASCCIPIVCKPVDIGGSMYFDGGVADPVPIDKAFQMGCDKVVVVLTKPVDYIRDGKTDTRGAMLIEKKYPLIAKALRHRADIYNSAVAKSQEYEKQGKCLIIAPDDCCGVTTLSKNKKSLDALYMKGYKDASKIKDFII